MTRKPIMVLIVSAMAITMLLASCSNILRVPEEKREWILDPTRPGPLPSRGEGILLVPRFRVSDLYSAKGFVYRRAEHEYESDYYNAFFASPGYLVSSAACEWLNRSGLFKEVLCASSRVEPTYVLEGEVLAIYGDLRVASSPSAVMEIRFTLIAPDSPPPGVIFRQVYRERVLLEKADPKILTAGWNTALARILQSLEHDLASVSK